MMNENTDKRTEMNTEAVSQVPADVTAEELDGHPADLIAGMSADEIKAVIAAAKSDDAAAAAADGKTEEAEAAAEEIPEVTMETVAREKERLGFSYRRLMRAVVAAALVMCTGFAGVNKLFSLYPYAITIDNDPVCYVASKADGEDVLKKLVDKFAVEGADVKAVTTTDDRLQINRADKMKLEDEQILSVDEAVEKLSDKDVLDPDGGDGDPVSFTVVSAKVDEKEFTPEPVYEADDSMLAGREEIKSEGRDGKQEISTVYTTENGILESTQEKVLKVLDKGESAVIVRGTLGLPEGADWKTYDGDPVYKNGEELMKTAMNYIGVGYILGGDDLSQGVSCIGLVKAIYAMYGVYIPMSMEGAREVGIPVSYDNMQVGDIICYTDHFALYAGNGQLLDARSGDGVALHPLDSVGQSVLTVRRIVN